MLFRKLCWRCHGDIVLDSYKNDDEEVVYELYCVQCSNTQFEKANTMVTFYKSLELKHKINLNLE